MEGTEYEELIDSISHRMTNDSRLRTLGRKRFGRNNKWTGASGFEHQIDVSLQNDTDALLIECKCWTQRVEPEHFLTFFGRLIDIRNAEGLSLNIRGALVTTARWTSGVAQLREYYSRLCSLYRVEETGEIADIAHRHFIELPFVPSGARIFPPTIEQI